MDHLRNDLRFALRLLARSPLYSAVVVLILAIGIGANTTIFSVFSATLLKPLPYSEPDRLVKLWEVVTTGSGGTVEFSYPDYADLRDSNTVFSGVAAYQNRPTALNFGGTVEQVAGGRVSYNFFDVLGVQPALGTNFRKGDDAIGAAPVVMLSYGAWKRRFGGDPTIVGRAIPVDDQVATVIGIAPPQFAFAPFGDAEVFTPLYPNGWGGGKRTSHWVHPVARLKPGVEFAQAQAEVLTISQRLAKEFADSNADILFSAVPLSEFLVGKVKPVIIVLMAAAGFVLLITCANIAGLMLARFTGRQRELSIRAALGASRWRIVTQLVTESLVLAIIGGCLGILLSHWAIPLLLAMLPKAELDRLPGSNAIQLDWTVVAFSFALSIAAGLVFGLAPALRSFRGHTEHLRERSEGATSKRTRTVQNGLVVAEIAVAMVLLVGAGLLLKSLDRLLAVDTGIQTSHLLTLKIQVPTRKYATDQQQAALHDQLLARVNALPGVRGAATVSTLPLDSQGNTTSFVKKGAPRNEEAGANYRVVSTSYFETMGVPLRAGRGLTGQDKPDTPMVVVINQALTERYFPKENPVGRQLDFFRSDPPFTTEIVGVVANERTNSIDQEPKPAVYFTFAQHPTARLSLVVRTSTEPNAMAGSVQRVIRELDGEIPIGRVAAMSEVINSSPPVYLRRFPGVLVTVFAGIALLLAAIGTYGLLSYLVLHRSREIGIRIALGAKPGDVLSMFMGNGLKLAAAGLAIGVLAALALSRLLTSVLYEVRPGDPTTFLGVAAVLISAAAIACYIPARRATKTDPMVALRTE